MKRKTKLILTVFALVGTLTATAFAAEKTQIIRKRDTFNNHCFSYDVSVVSFEDTAAQTDINKVNDLFAQEAKNALYSVSELCTSTSVAQNKLHLTYLQTVADLTDRYVSVEVTKQLKLDGKQIYNIKEGIVVDLLTGEKVPFDRLFNAKSDYMQIVEAQTAALGLGRNTKVQQGQYYLTDTHLVILNYSGVKDANGTVTREYHIPRENIAFVMKDIF